MLGRRPYPRLIEAPYVDPFDQNRKELLGQRPLLTVDTLAGGLWGQSLDQTPEAPEMARLDLFGKVDAVVPEAVSLEQVPPLGDDLREARYSPCLRPVDSITSVTSSARASSV